MVPSDLRAICDSLNNEHDTGGQSRLARLCGWHHSTVWRKLNGKSRIAPSDELAIQKAVERSSCSATRPRLRPDSRRK
jgi:DNA-binding transcriptional regulator YdaS (Cro superfamily)